MSEQRIKGQEVQVIYTSPAGTEVGLDGTVSFEIEFQMDILSQGYLGEVAERKDDIFKGCRGRAEFHIRKQSALQFIQRVKDRAQRRTPASAQFNVTAVLNFPNGERPRVLLEDVAWGSMPLNIGGRAEYVSFTTEFECSDGRFLGL